MSEVLLERAVGELRATVSVRFAVLYAVFEGNITNEISDDFQLLLSQIRELSLSKSELIIDVANVDFCYSTGVKAFLALGQDYLDRPPLKFLISNKMWQITIRSIVGFSPHCSVEVVLPACAAAPAPTVSDNPTNENSEASSSHSGVCCHASTRTEEDQFFAPTGKGTIVTRTICEKCGFEMKVDREYFD
eukprot:gene12997-14994_t